MRMALTWLGLSNASDGDVIGRVFVTSLLQPVTVTRHLHLPVLTLPILRVTVPLNHWTTCWVTLPVVLEILYFKNPLYGTETALLILAVIQEINAEFASRQSEFSNVQENVSGGLRTSFHPFSNTSASRMVASSKQTEWLSLRSHQPSWTASVELYDQRSIPTLNRPHGRIK